tara:strand:+ start:377 stop:1411 length:1035 start_codon:yes stop_codon:yes gene_type:complete
MYKINISLTKEAVLNKISSYQIFSYYLGRDFKSGIVLSSPFRQDDKPSFSLFTDRKGTIRYKDFGTGESGDCFNFIQKKFGIGFYDCLIRINNDFKLDLMYSGIGRTTVPYDGFKTAIKELNFNPKKSINVKVQPYTFIDEHYWNQYGIDKNLLKVYNVFSCKCVFIGDKTVATYVNNNPIYGYLFYKDEEYTWKIYRPLSINGYKWMSNTNRTVFQGWDQLPRKGDFIIITKALKDVMVLRTLGFISVALQNEIAGIKDTVAHELYERFNDVYILNDFDYTGVRGANKLKKKYGFKPIFLQCFKTRSNGFKDISDFRKSHSYEESKSLIKKLIDKWKYEENNP